MRLQLSSLVMYEQRRAIALSNRRDADFDLVDDDGNVELSFRQTITWERDTAAYDAACNPPIDDSMERMEQRNCSARRDATVTLRRERRRQNPKAKPVRFQQLPRFADQQGEPLDVSYKTADRPRGNVALW